MNADDLMNSVMDHHKKIVKKATKNKIPQVSKLTKRVPEPAEPLDPVNEDIKPTLIKVCAYIEWMAQEIREIREELETKPDLSAHNTMSLKIDQLDDFISDLSARVEVLE